MRILLIIMCLSIFQIAQSQDDFFNQELKELIQVAENNFSDYAEGLMETDYEEWKESFVNIDIPHVAFDGRLDQYGRKHCYFSTRIMSNTDAISEEENVAILQEKILKFPTNLGYEITLIQTNDLLADYVVKNIKTEEDVAFIKLNLKSRTFEMNPIMDISAIMNGIEQASLHSLNDFEDIKGKLNTTEKGVNYYKCTTTFDYFNDAEIIISSGYPKLGLQMYYYSPAALAYQLEKESLLIKGMKKSKKSTALENSFYFEKFSKKKRTVSISILQSEEGEVEIYFQAGKK